jgi:hypothetical protein
MDEIQKGINFVLSHDVTGICTAGDIRVLPMVLKACENAVPLSLELRDKLIEAGRSYQPLFI